MSESSIGVDSRPAVAYGKSSRRRLCWSREIPSTTPHRLLLGARDLADDLEAPLVDIAEREPQLVERDAELRGPALLGRGHVAGPHRVPRPVFLGVVGQHHVALHAGGVELEHVGGALVVIAVDRDHHRVTGRIDIAPREQPADVVRLRIVGPHADVDRVIVVLDREARLELRLAAVLGKALAEPALHRRGRPAGFVEPAVDRDRARAPHRVRAHGIGDRVVGDGHRRASHYRQHRERTNHVG
jgi:hypothetical protein